MCPIQPRSKWQCYDAYCRVCMGLGLCPSRILCCWTMCEGCTEIRGFHFTVRRESDLAGVELLLHLPDSQCLVSCFTHAAVLFLCRLHPLFQKSEVILWSRTIHLPLAMLWWRFFSPPDMDFTQISWLCWFWTRHFTQIPWFQYIFQYISWYSQYVSWYYHEGPWYARQKTWTASGRSRVGALPSRWPC